MTHLYAYIPEGYSEQQLKALVSNMKGALCEGFNLRAASSTVGVKELEKGEHSDNLGVLALVYTAKGKGFGVKKKFARLLNEAVVSALGNPGEVKMIIKEHASDMVGLNGTLRSQVQAACSSYEES